MGHKGQARVGGVSSVRAPFASQLSGPIKQLYMGLLCLRPCNSRPSCFYRLPGGKKLGLSWPALSCLKMFNPAHCAVVLENDL